MNKPFFSMVKMVLMPSRKPLNIEAIFLYNLFSVIISYFFLKMNTIAAKNATIAKITIVPKTTLFFNDSIKGLSHEVTRLPSRFH